MTASNQVYEVFVTARRGEAARHVGSVVAPDPVLALHHAKEVYTRRTECVALWLAPRSAIISFTPEEGVLFELARAKDYRQAGYFTRHEDRAETPPQGTKGKQGTDAPAPGQR